MNRNEFIEQAKKDKENNYTEKEILDFLKSVESIPDIKRLIEAGVFDYESIHMPEKTIY